MRASAEVEGRVTTPLMRLQDAAFTRVLIVTLAEPTPDPGGGRAPSRPATRGIEPYGWVINASLAASDTTDPVLPRRAVLEHGHIRRVHDELAARLWITPWTPESASTERRPGPAKNAE